MSTPIEIVQRLASFQHRGVATENEKGVIAYLSSLFDSKQVQLDEFKTPKTYVQVVWWLLSGLIVGLVASNIFPLPALVLTITAAGLSMAYFNWYASLATKLPPQVKSTNIIVKDQSSKPQKLILMAHWDTAPVSFLYRPAMVANFRVSLQFALVLILLAVIVAGLQLLMSSTLTIWLSIGLSIYFLIQGITATIDFFRLGYSNGASDNATGVAAAIETANRLWLKNLPNLEVELVLTGAEEVGMIGAHDYFIRYCQNFSTETHLINFDTLGSGNLKIITQTGSLTNIEYSNKLVQLFKEKIEQSPDLQHVTTGAWHTADFDSVWFQRVGMPCVTLAALDENGRMPNIHRPTDVLTNVDFRPMLDAIDLAEAVAMELATKKPLQ
jgi:hypothetical protein